MQGCLPQFEPFVDDSNLQTIAKKPASRLPGFRYVGPKIHKTDKVVLLGDAIHTVKPYFGLGANSAFEDVTSLDKCLDSHDNGADALRAFSRERAPEAKALVQISRGFDRPGFRGFVSFILPIILDSIFHAKFPKVFGPNTIASLQRRDTFVRVRWNKRRDRLPAPLSRTNRGARGRAVPRGVLCAFVGAPRAGDAGGAARDLGRRGGPRGDWPCREGVPVLRTRYAARGWRDEDQVAGPAQPRRWRRTNPGTRLKLMAT